MNNVSVFIFDVALQYVGSYISAKLNPRFWCCEVLRDRQQLNVRAGLVLSAGITFVGGFSGG
jgi:hypothetical protein